MSIEEKRDEIIAEYHCQDVHGELCIDCTQCRECLKEDLIKLENLVRADERAKVLEEMKPFFDEVSEYVLDWICDDINGEFINPQNDECWCAEHCDNGTGYECIKKWCEFKRLKSHKITI